MIVFGYPTEGQKERRKPVRADMKHIVHENAYRRMDASELREMLTRDLEPEKYDEWIHAFCRRKYNSDFSVEMTRSVRRYLEDFAE